MPDCLGNAFCDPLKAGVGIYHESPPRDEAPFGTLGCFVTRTQGDYAGEPMGLSAAHVLTDWGSARGGMIAQPGGADEQDPRNLIGPLLDFTAVVTYPQAAQSDPDFPRPRNRADAALVLLRGRDLDPGYPISRVGRPSGWVSLAQLVELVGSPVIQMGAATAQVRRGRIGRFPFTKTVAWPDVPAEFVDQILIEPADPAEPAANHGDSGAVWVTEGDLRVVGLTIATHEQDDRVFAVASPIEFVLKALDIELL